MLAPGCVSCFFRVCLLCLLPLVLFTCGRLLFVMCFLLICCCVLMLSLCSVSCLCCGFCCVSCLLFLGSVAIVLFVCCRLCVCLSLLGVLVLSFLLLSVPQVQGKKALIAEDFRTWCSLSSCWLLLFPCLLFSLHLSLPFPFRFRFAASLVAVNSSLVSCGSIFSVFCLSLLVVSLVASVFDFSPLFVHIHPCEHNYVCSCVYLY